MLFVYDGLQLKSLCLSTALVQFSLKISKEKFVTFWSDSEVESCHQMAWWRTIVSLVATRWQHLMVSLSEAHTTFNHQS